MTFDSTLDLAAKVQVSVLLEPLGPDLQSQTPPPNQGTVFFALFVAVTRMVMELDHIMRGGEP